MTHNVHPIFRQPQEDFQIELLGYRAIDNEMFQAFASKFPELPYSMSDKVLLALGMYYNGKTNFMQQMFWVYMFMECTSEVYDYFVSFHSDEIKGRVSPTC